jgi:hypothetical protein
MFPSMINKFIVKISKSLLFAIWVGGISLIFLEIAYRFYWIDFYKIELNGLNTNQLNQISDSTMLVFGDSFSAHPESYVSILRQQKAHWRIINCAVSGTGSLEMSRMAALRIKNFKPKKVTFQLYVGNDLLDIYPPINWLELSFGRNLFWTISNWFEVIDFLNYRLAHLINQSKEGSVSLLKPPDFGLFDPEKYNARERLYLQADPSFVVNSVNVNTIKYEKAFYTMISKIKNTIELLPYDCSVEIIVIPHCTQVSNFYANNLASLGMKNKALLNNYAFLSKLQMTFNDKAIVTDVLPILKENDSPEHRVFYENDIHLTPFGQSLLVKK